MFKSAAVVASVTREREASLDATCEDDEVAAVGRDRPRGIAATNAEACGRSGEDPLPQNAPFPQADDLRKVLEVVEIVGEGCDESEEIRKRVGFVRRQADFYGNAGVFLGLLIRKPGGFDLSIEGLRFLSCDASGRKRLVIEGITRLPVFGAALASIRAGVRPELAEISAWIREASGLGGRTPSRRAKTVIAWTTWVAESVALSHV